MDKNTVIEVSKIPDLLQQNYQFIDIRDSASYQKEHLQRFENIPFQSKEQYKTYLQKNKPVVLICYTGTQSKELAEYLNKDGYHCYSIEGGFYMVINYEKPNNYY